MTGGIGASADWRRRYQNAGCYTCTYNPYFLIRCRSRVPLPSPLPETQNSSKNLNYPDIRRCFGRPTHVPPSCGALEFFVFRVDNHTITTQVRQNCSGSVERESDGHKVVRYSSYPHRDVLTGRSSKNRPAGLASWAITDF